jgi:hypothetical protein
MTKGELKHKLHSIPNWIAVCEGPEDVVILHQDAFAADFNEDELYLLGCAIKYAGICGKEVHIVGRPGATLLKQ